MRRYKETAELTNEVIVEIIGQCKREGVLTEFLDMYGTEIAKNFCRHKYAYFTKTVQFEPFFWWKKQGRNNYYTNVIKHLLK